jgi:hypothetical protein
MEVNINELRKLLKAIDEINEVDISTITWVEDGKVVEINPVTMKNWKYIGLSNTWFILTNAYKEQDDFSMEHDNFSMEHDN